MPLDYVLVGVELLVVGGTGGRDDVVGGEGVSGDELLDVSDESGIGALLELLHLLGWAVVCVELLVVGGKGGGVDVLLVVSGEGDSSVLLGLLHLLRGAVDGGVVDGQCNGLPGLAVCRRCAGGSEHQRWTTQSWLSGLVLRSHVNLVRLGVGVLDTVTVVLLDLARAVLVATISGSAGALVSVPQTCSWTCLVLMAMISGTAGVVFSVLVTRSSSDSSLVLPGGDDGADVEDLSIFSN